jgi:hypothetical protein
MKDFRCGLLGGEGFANSYLLSYEDGTPIERDGKVFVVGNMPTPTYSTNGIVSIRASTQVILEVDPLTCGVRVLSHLMFSRDSLVVGENSSAIKFDRNANQWRILTSPWGSFGQIYTNQVIRSYTTKENILAPGLHIIGSGSELSLGATYSVYDPDFYWDSGSSLWRLLFSEMTSSSTFPYPVSATSSDFTTWTRTGAVSDTSANKEGGKWVNWDGTMRAIFASVNEGHRMYSTTMAAVASNSGIGMDVGSVPSHPCYFPIRRNGVDQWYAFGFSHKRFQRTPYVADYSWGALEVYAVDQTRTGWTYPERVP